MSPIYYAIYVFLMLIGSIIYLVRAKEPNLYSIFNICPRCGARMMKQVGGKNLMEQACPSCGCCSDEFGNNL